jgi:hypothetical protein
VRLYFKNTQHTKQAGEMDQVVNCLPSKCEALSQTPVATKKTIKTELLYQILLYYPWAYIQSKASQKQQRYLHTHVYHSTIHNINTMESNWVLINQRMDKINVVYIHNGELALMKNIKLYCLQENGSSC